MSFENNDVLASLFANAIRSPQPSTSSAAMASSPAAARPSLAHSKSIGAEPSTPRRPQAGVKRVPRRSTASLSQSYNTTPIHLSNRKGGSVSPPSHHQQSYGASSPFAGAKFSDSPSARAIPLPPAVWFEDDESPCPPSDTESISSFTTTSSSSSDSLPFSGSLSPSAALATSQQQHQQRAFRVTPLQLIAAVSAL